MTRRGCYIRVLQASLSCYYDTRPLLFMPPEVSTRLGFSAVCRAADERVTWLERLVLKIKVPEMPSSVAYSI